MTSVTVDEAMFATAQPAKCFGKVACDLACGISITLIITQFQTEPQSKSLDGRKIK